jgi:hypothetical protein
MLYQICQINEVIHKDQKGGKDSIRAFWMDLSDLHHRPVLQRLRQVGRLGAIFYAKNRVQKRVATDRLPQQLLARKFTQSRWYIKPHYFSQFFCGGQSWKGLGGLVVV